MSGEVISPIFIELSGSDRGVLGEAYLAMCGARGSPLSTYKWLKEFRTFGTQYNIEVEKGNFGLSLKISGLA